MTSNIKRFLSILLMLTVLLCSAPALAGGDGEIELPPDSFDSPTAAPATPAPKPTATPAPSVVYPASVHPYADNTDQSWEYAHPKTADYLKISFSEVCCFESGMDYLCITDESGSAQTFSGLSLASKYIILPGDSFTLRLTSDADNHFYGFDITEITAATQAEYEKYLCTPQFTIDLNGTITSYLGQLAALVIPDVIDEIKVSAIGDGVFRDNVWLTAVSIPDGISAIGADAFLNCALLTAAVIPDTLASIGDNAFYGCDLLTAYVTEGSPAHTYCSANGILCRYFVSPSANAWILPAELTEIHEEAFINLSATQIVIPDGCTGIGAGVFRGCTSLEYVFIPDSTANIADDAFDDCDDLTFVCGIGSKAAEFAEEKGIACIFN